jgi:hypothetical protein
VRLVDNQVLPLELEEGGHAESDAFKGRETDVELAWLKLVFEDVFSLDLGRNQVQNTAARQPLLELKFPIRDHSLRHDDQKVVVHFFKLFEEG